jgi:anti-sigma factor RsiW
MSRPTDQDLLAFIEGSLDEAGRRRVMDALDGDPALARDLRRAARGLEALDALVVAEGRGDPLPLGKGGPGGHRGVPRWWLAVAVAASVALAVPTTLWFSGTAMGAEPSAPPVSGRPSGTEPSFVLVLQGTWPDAGSLPAGEVDRRASEYWAWTTELARRDVLLAAGDLAWEPGARLGDAGRSLPAADVAAPDFVVGMFALRVRSLEEAEAIARDCPHLRYGGSVSVRRVGQGFVTTGGFADWSG